MLAPSARRCCGPRADRRPTGGRRYENMVRLPILDDVLYNLQRQGRIVFYVSTLEGTRRGIFADAVARGASR